MTEKINRISPEERARQALHAELNCLSARILEISYLQQLLQGDEVKNIYQITSQAINNTLALRKIYGEQK